MLRDVSFANKPLLDCEDAGPSQARLLLASFSSDRLVVYDPGLFSRKLVSLDGFPLPRETKLNSMNLLITLRSSALF
jgi:hypothetical protein